MFTTELDNIFSNLKATYGANSIARVEDMLNNQVGKLPLQDDCKYVMPNLSSTPWKLISDYPEIKNLADILKNNHSKIKQEFLAIKNYNLPEYQHYKFQVPDWKALYVFRDGVKCDSQNDQMPLIFNIFDEYIKDLICPLGEMHFSILKPNSKIPLHSDLWNFALNLHFAVDIPTSGDCAINVAGEVKTWVNGECLLFDYSFEHEAWNYSGHERTCLLMDIWHPEVTLAERIAIVSTFCELEKLVSARKDN